MKGTFYSLALPAKKQRLQVFAYVSSSTLKACHLGCTCCYELRIEAEMRSGLMFTSLQISSQRFRSPMMLCFDGDVLSIPLPSNLAAVVCYF